MGQSAVSVKYLKKDIARMLTVAKQRQLALEGMQKKEEERYGPPRRPYRPGALLQATLVASHYPLVVGNEYRLVLRRSSQASQLTLDYSPVETATKVARRTKGRHQKDYVIRIFSKRLRVVPEVGEALKDPHEYTMEQHSQLSVRLVPRISGECDLDVFVYSKNNLLQILQLSFPAEEKAA